MRYKTDLNRLCVDAVGRESSGDASTPPRDERVVTVVAAHVAPAYIGQAADASAEPVLRP